MHFPALCGKVRRTPADLEFWRDDLTVSAVDDTEGGVDGSGGGRRGG